ncbi:hypothetical protein HYX70_03715 [Candidatus Saccharibacteria bacterium]|nr:hypothetical protein [Candidatus Saccharibacteria bacterium]
MFSKKAILQAVSKGLLKFEPFDKSQIESAHINFHLSDSLKIQPKGFAVAKTIEKITLSGNICGIIEGRATLAKQGISVEQSSTFIEPGSDNQITLEIFNASDKRVELKAGQEIAKIFILKVVDNI